MSGYSIPMKTELTHFITPDGLRLPGLLYEPIPALKTDLAVIYLHGNGSSSVIYGHEMHNTLAAKLVKTGVAYFPFNNRGA